MPFNLDNTHQRESYKPPQKRGAIILLALAFATCNSCMFGYYTGGTVATVEDSMPCPSKPDVDWQCVLEFPEFGYLGINSVAYRGDQTFITVRLAPRQGVEVRWFGSEITLFDLTKNAPVQRQKLDPNPVVGGDKSGHFTDHRLVGYGRSIETRFYVKPLVDHMELRFPPVLVGGTQVKIPSVQLREKMRIPVVVPQTRS